ncbi:MAG TPA: GWxTD domain-containing protein [Gemmatimonadaceae bacterium]|nr:GWxTD domain-containing protein [Gemmatimonadaceae bacterium]
MRRSALVVLVTLLFRAPLADAQPSADSTATLRALDEAVRANPGDHDAWYRRGMLAWTIARAQRRAADVERVAVPSLLQVAESSLQRAVKLDENEPRYLIELARFRWSSTATITRRRANGMYERALAMARKQHDSVAMAEALAALGVIAWRRYEGIADRHIYSAIFKDPDGEGLIDDERAIAYFVENASKLTASKHWSGQREYDAAWKLFDQAIIADPGNRRARAGRYMMLVDRKRWEEARHEAMLHLRTSPCDALAWLTRGLAAHELRAEDEATVAFDSALRCLPPHERERLDALGRVLSPKDGRDHAQLPASERVLSERLYWLMSDPLWLTRANEHRLEYLSRVTAAELRWSVEELDLRGADTDRGDLFVRYGPPPAVISFPPDPDFTQEMRIRLLWWYTEGVAFIFRMIPGYGVASIHADYERYVRALRDTIPVSWANLGVERGIDTIPLQAVRFRGPEDSTDVLVIADIPADSLVRGLDLARVALQVGLNIFNWRAERIARDSIREVIDVTRAEPVTTRAWRKRLPPGIYLYRVEALQPDALRGARATSRLELVAGDGFGMSDVLAARMIEPKEESTLSRWSEFRVLPMTGVLRRTEPLALLWETYALAADSGVNRYRVSITIEQRNRPGALARIGAAIVGGVRSAVGRSSRGEGRVTLTYDRDVPAAPVALDYLTVDVRGLERGAYTVTVDVEDVLAKRRIARSSSLTIVD